MSISTHSSSSPTSSYQPEQCPAPLKIGLVLTVLALSAIATLTCSLLLALQPLLNNHSIIWLCGPLLGCLALYVGGLFLLYQIQTQPQKSESTQPNPSSPETSTISEEVSKSEQITNTQAQTTPPQPAPLSLTIHLSSLTGGSFPITFEQGKTLREVIDTFSQNHNIGDFSLFFSGKTILDAALLSKDGHLDAYKWASSYETQTLSKVHIVLKKGVMRSKAPVEQATDISAHFRFTDGTSVYFQTNASDTLNESSAKLAVERGFNPITTYLRIIFCGRILNKPELLSSTMGDLEKECEFRYATCVHVVAAPLSEQESETFCKLLEKNKFPKFPQNETVEKTIEMIRVRLWSECDRILRRRPRAGSQELEKQLNCLNAIKDDPTISRTLRVFVTGLADLANAAYQIYAASASASYDELVTLLERQYPSIPPLPQDEGEQIELQIGKTIYSIGSHKLVALSPYFDVLIHRGFKESKTKIDIIELQDHSPHLFDYFDHGSALDLSKLSDRKIGKLLDSAEAFSLSELSLMCQKTLIERIKQSKTVTKHMRAIFKKTPVLEKALGIRLSQDLWKSSDFVDKIKTIQKHLGNPPSPPAPKIAHDCIITLIMPFGKKEILKSHLMKSSFFNSLFSREWKESAESEFEVDLNIPNEIFDYLVTGSDAYKNLEWEQIKKLLPFTEFLGLYELSYHFKKTVCQQLLSAREGNLEKPFCEICAYLRKEIEQWA